MEMIILLAITLTVIVSEYHSSWGDAAKDSAELMYKWRKLQLRRRYPGHESIEYVEERI